jgi:beta-lactamase superfamily II metal-dependent hydrolase
LPRKSREWCVATWRKKIGAKKTKNLGSQEPRADVLVAPHHSSRTSSTPEFIVAVQSRWTVLPVGYRNRFGHPQDEVVERYRASESPLLRTDSDGISVQEYRGLRRRYQTAPQDSIHSRLGA